MSGNSALRPQIGVENVESIIDTHATDITASGVSLIPSGDATWTNWTSNVEATLALAAEDSGYILCKFEFVAGTPVDVRIPLLLST